MSTLMQASKQWASRPDDQRFLTLDELHRSVKSRRSESWTATPLPTDLRIVADGDRIAVDVYDPTVGGRRQVEPTHWAFGQLASFASAPVAYLRKLPTQLAAINLQWGLEHMPLREDALVLAQSNGSHTLRAITSASYGRIWDDQVVSAVQRVNHDGRWQVPAASYATTNPKRATTLYASDRDVFIFLVDPKNEIEVGGEKMFRGFFAWNSEVGSATFGLTTFLYRYVCDNRIVWDATDVQEIRIRHTSGAPDRFAYEGERYLRRYAEESTERISATILAAKAKELPEARNPETLMEWMQERGFSKPVAKASIDAAVSEEGQARSLWDIVNGITAHARSIPNTNDRVDLETRAGKLLRLVAA